MADNLAKYKYCAIALIIVLVNFNCPAYAIERTRTITPTATKTTTKSSTVTPSTVKPSPGKGDRREDVAGLHKGSVEVATLQIYNKVDQLRADPLLSSLLKSAASSDSPYGSQTIEGERAALANIDVAENMAANLIRQDKFDVEGLNGIEKDCIVLGPKSHENIVDLSSGNAIFAPGRNIIVLTDLGHISISAGSIVCVLMPAPGMVAVYDLHDGAEKAVTIKTKDETLSLSPGKHVILSNQTKEELAFEKINPAHRIAYRKLENRTLPSGTKVYFSEFSIPSAILYLKPLRTLLLSDNKEDRKLADRMLKNFVILEDVFSDGAEPYKMPRPESLRISANVK